MKAKPASKPAKVKPPANGNGHEPKLADFRPQRINANKHKPFGLKLIGDSIQRDGYSAPMVAAADREIFIGSERFESVGDVLNEDPIIVHSDGTRPVIHVRDDIPNADDPRAKRLGVADNIIAHIDYEPDGALLAMLADEDEAIKKMIAADDMSSRAVMGQATSFPDGFDMSGLPSEDRAPFRQATFTLHDSQFEQVEAALKASKALGEFTNSPNENSNGNALARICETFITEHGNG